MTAFARDVKTGALTQLKGAAGCVRPGGLGGCASGVGLLGATALAISPDGRSLYVAGRDADAIASFAIDPTGGALLQLGGKQACMRGGDDPGACTAGRALAGVDALAIAPDGATLYAAAKDADAVAVLQRDATTGALTQQPGPTGCIRLGGGLGCTTGRALAQPSALAIAAGGRDVYVASASGNAVSILQRDRDRGCSTQPAGVAGCIGQGIADCASAPLLTAPGALALGSDGTSLTVATAGDGAILTLASRHRHRRARGRTRRPPAASRRRRPPAASRSRSSGRRPRSRSPRAATRSTPQRSGGLIALGRQAPPTCLARELRAGVGVPTQILLPCTDPNGDALTYAIASKATHGTPGWRSRADRSSTGRSPASRASTRSASRSATAPGATTTGHRHRARHA